MLTSQLDNIRIKLSRLIAQLEVVSGSEFPNTDSRLGIDDLRTYLEKAKRRLLNFESHPLTLQNSISTQVNHQIMRVTELLGFMVRSTSTRNLFELYYPFKEIARRIVSDDVRLILSSDWQYSPFTYPFGLDELPNYILIGLPASESENALIFPTAGHELGHNVWKAHDFETRIRLDLESIIYDAFDNRKVDFETTFPSMKGANIRSDMFVQPLITRSVAFGLRQLEELFCDFIGLQLFGKSYLLAFDYILSPTVSGSRSGFYPSTRQRAALLKKYANLSGTDFTDYELRFSPEKMSGVKEVDFTIEIADAAVSSYSDNVFSMSKRHMDSHHMNCLSHEEEEHARECFSLGIPTSRVLSLGDLLNAAWTIYNDKPSAPVLQAQGAEMVQFLTDLIIKSAENLEYESF